MENCEEVNKTTAKPRKSIKVWSENLQRYYYNSKDPNYYNDYFHKTNHPMTCEICGKTVTCQMYSHLKSKKCLMKRQEAEIARLSNEIEKLKIVIVHPHDKKINFTYQSGNNKSYLDYVMRDGKIDDKGVRVKLEHHKFNTSDHLALQIKIEN